MMLTMVVQERSSAKRKELFRTVQINIKYDSVLQLMLDMKVRWSSTFLMVNRAEKRREVHILSLICSMNGFDLIQIIQAVDVFVYEIGLQEKDLKKRAKLDALRLTDDEWANAGKFADILSVCFSLYFFRHTNILSVQFADAAQQAFSSYTGSTLHLALPALETLHKAWSTRAKRTKYGRFAPALNAAANKINEYYEKTTKTPAYVIVMGKLAVRTSLP